MQRPSSKHHVIISTLVICIACAPEGDDVELANQDSGENDDEELRIFGNASFDNCLPSERALILDAVRLGRWVTDTEEFVACVQNGGYGACSSDEAPSVASGLAVTRTPNNYEIECDWLDGSGYANYDSWDNGNTEAMTLDIEYLTDNLGRPPMPGRSAVGRTIWHELMHRHGYRHGISKNAEENRGYCDQQPGWVWNEHSMPHIVGRCFEETALHTTHARLTAAGYEEPLLTHTTNLIEISLTLGGIINDAQHDQTSIAVAWRRKMRVQHSGKCMRVFGGSHADNALIQQAPCSISSNAQRWVAMPLVNNPVGSDPRLVIMNVNSGKCLDRPWGAVADHTVLQQFTCHGNVEQQFRRRPTGQYEAMTANGASNQCLDIAGESLADGATLQMFQCKAANAPSIGNQVFSMVF